MGKALIIGCGGVASVAIHKCCQNSEKYFLKLKAFRRIATRYDKLAATYLGFICIASILIWLK